MGGRSWIAVGAVLLATALPVHAESVTCCGGKSTATIKCSEGWSATCACDATSKCPGAGAAGHEAECSCTQVVGSGAYDGKWHLDGKSYVLESAAGSVRIPAGDAAETSTKSLEIKSTADAKGEPKGKKPPVASSKTPAPAAAPDLSCHRTCCESGDCATACLFDAGTHAECKDGKASIRCGGP